MFDESVFVLCYCTNAMFEKMFDNTEEIILIELI